MEIKLKNTIISTDNYPFMVAEIGANHGGDLNIFMNTIEAAIKSGANGIKLQTYTPESMTLDCDTEWFIIKDGPWAGCRLWDLYKEGSLPREWHYKAFELCARNRVECFSTPFSESDVDFLETLDCPIYKVASFEITHSKLVEYIAKKRKPMILSTGMVPTEDVQQLLSDANILFMNVPFILLHCTSSYPTPNNEANIGRIKDLQRITPLVGYSDHTIGELAASGAIALGAVMVEKHFVLGSVESIDSKFSAKPVDFKALADCCASMYEVTKKPYKQSQEKYKKFRRSIFASKDIEKGEMFTRDNVTIVRPSDGLEPFYYDLLTGEQFEKAEGRGISMFYRRAKFAIKRGYPITHELVEPPLKKT